MDVVQWARLEADAPDLAASVRESLSSTDRQVMATRTMIGSPRVSGAEVLWWRDELCLVTPPGAGKARDLRGDARYGLHSTPGGESQTSGDAKVNGVAVEITGAAHETFVTETGVGPDHHVFALRIRTATLATASPDGSVSVVGWRPGEGVRPRARR